MTSQPSVQTSVTHRRGRLRTAVSAVACGLVALTLSACSTDLHPGNAAVVDGTAISPEEVDGLVSAACAYETEMGKVDPQSYPVIAITDLRTSFVNQLIRNVLARDAAEEIGGLHVSQDQVDKFAAGNTIPEGLDATAKTQIGDYFRETAETDLLVAVIGAHLEDETVTDAKNVQQADLDAGGKYLTTYSKDVDVSINPSFGTWNGSAVEGGSGSLSDPVSAAPDSADSLPGDQKCG